MSLSENKRISHFAAALILTVLVVGIRFSMLQKSPEPNGLDGYFYALQAKSLVETGHLENPSYQCGYFLCGACAFLCHDAITGVKVWSAISSAGICLAIFLLFYSLSGKFFLSLLGFSLAAFSPTLTVMGINYINNQTGVLFLLLYATCVSELYKRRSEPIPEKIFLCAGTLLFFVLSILSHKLTLVFTCVLTLVLCIPLLVAVLKKYRSLRLAFIFGLVVFFLVAAFFAFRFFRLHSPRFMDAFSAPQFFPIIPHGNLRDSIGFCALEMSLYAPLIYIFAKILLSEKRPNRHLLLLVPIVYFPCWDFNTDMGFRMWMNAVPLGIPLIVYFLYLLLTWNGKSLKKIASIIFGVLSLFLLGTTVFTPKLYDPKSDPPYTYYKKVIETIDLESDSLLIAHLGLNHVYTYEKDLKDALNWLPNFYVPPEKLWRLSRGVNEKRIREILESSGALPESSENLIRKIDSNYVLVREDLWQIYLLHEDERIAEALSNWYNPHEVRPSYIRKPKKSLQKKQD